jgi:hypothetical protein
MPDIEFIVKISSLCDTYQRLSQTNQLMAATGSGFFSSL